jgi:hypothetical protein
MNESNLIMVERSLLALLGMAVDAGTEGGGAEHSI